MSNSDLRVPAIIEAAGPEHLAEIAALAAIVWRAHYPGIISREQIEYMLTQMYDLEVMRHELESGITYERLLVEGKLRGFAALGPTSTPGELKLHKLYIHPDWQRQGLGAFLLQHVEAVARDRRFFSVVLAVNKRNTQAVAAYRKHGFTIGESVIVDIGRGFFMDDYVMVKVLGS